MGLAASQARLLSITSRISDNELRAQIINNQKMRLSADSSKVSENYINALNKTNLVFANYDENDKAQNVPLTFKNLTAFNQYNNQYGLTNTAGNILVSESDAEKYRVANHNQDEFLKQYGIEYTTSYWDTLDKQLQTNESFYSNPDGDGVAEPDGTTYAKYTSAGQATDNITTDGRYNFFSSEELRAMYEGVKNADGTTKIASYEETIKSSEYTDFAGYVDSFAQQAAALKRAAAQRGQLLGSYAQAALSAGETFGKINALGAKPTAEDLNNINEALGNDIAKYYDGATFNASTMGIDATILNSFREDGGKYYIDSTTNEYFEDNKTTKFHSNGYDAEALYLTIGGINYARVEDPSSSGKIIFANISTTNPVANFYEWNGTSMNVFTYTEPDDEGNDQTITPTVNITRSLTGSDVTFQYSEEDENGNTVTQKIQYPPFGTSGDLKISYEFSQTDFLNKIKDILKAQATNIFQEIGMGTSGVKLKESEFVDSYTYTDNTGATQTYTFTDKEKEVLLAQTATETNVSRILENICTLLFGETNKNKITNSDDMTEFLDIIMSGNLKNFKAGAAIELNNTGSPVTIEWKDLNDSNNIEFCVNAYILDTMMDLFGEPVYGYMKGGEGKWQVANEEANWYINLFNKMEKCGYQMLPNGLANSTEWIQFALENDIVIMEQVDSVANWQPITHTSCSDIIEQNDSTAATIAEAEYNKAMRQIEAKDEMFDLELKNIDTEHSSLQSEYESVKKAMSGNIERTFQMYS